MRESRQRVLDDAGGTRTPTRGPSRCPNPGSWASSAAGGVAAVGCFPAHAERVERGPLVVREPPPGVPQLVVVGADPERVEAAGATVRVATLGLAAGPAPLRIVASIVLAELARQAGAADRPPPPRARPARALAMWPTPMMLMLLIE